MIDVDAIRRHGRLIPFRDLIVFDSARRLDCALRAWGFLLRADASDYKMHDGATLEEWKRTVHLLADANPHWATERKGDAMRRVEATR